ncbi:MAG TPA: hypothetical protein PK156_37215 [Polyangium sp.]|nr:hypothetical protein [Polyangium sp.]
MSESWDRAQEFAETMRDDARDWATGRSALVRLPLLGYLGYGGIRHILDPLYKTWFGGITLAFHEMGHILFMGLGRTMMILGGSIMQLFIPTAAGVYLLLRQRDWFGVAVCMSWLAYALWEMATYMADAVREELGLVGFSDNPGHDWSILFGQWHLLNYCEGIATFVRVCAFGTWGASMALGGWLCWRMWETRDEERMGI